MEDTIESILGNKDLLIKAFNDIETSILTLEQIDRRITSNKYQGRIYSKEEGTIIIDNYKNTNNPKELNKSNRARGKWEIFYDRINKEVYSR